MLSRFVKFINRYLSPPPAVQASLNYRFRREDLINSMGGPLNGQKWRRAVVEQIFSRLKFCAVIETGTCYGATTAYFCRLFDGPVKTVESLDVTYRFAIKALAKYPNCEPQFGDSVEFVAKQVPLYAKDNAPPFIYLDAHHFGHLPLREELALVVKTLPAFVVLIDDFQVPGDPGYEYDDYGPDMALTLDYIAPVLADGCRVYFPAVPSAEETGRRRGYVFVARGEEAVKVLDSIDILRSSPVTPSSAHAS